MDLRTWFPRENLGFRYVLGVALFLPRRPTTAVVPTTAWPWSSLERKCCCLVPNHGRGPHHGLAVIGSGKESVVCWNLTTGVVATRGWPWSRPRAWCQPGAGRGCLCFHFVEFCFLNRGRGYHHGLAVVDSVCDIVMLMPRVLIPYARFRMKNDLALEWDV